MLFASVGHRLEDPIPWLDGFDRISVFEPGAETASQGTNPVDAATLQHQRHPGAGGFVGSGAVEDDLSLSGNLVMAGLDLFQAEDLCAWNSFGL